MADAAARREARRRRILENSESRLLKISGRDATDVKINGTNEQYFAEPAQELIFENHINQQPCNSFERLLQEPMQLPRELNYESSEPTNPEELANLLLGTSSSSSSSSSVPPQKPSILNNFLFNRLVYVALAFIINSLIILEIDNPIGKSVIIPFLLLLLPRVYLITTKENSPQENMMYAVLMLCNIRPSLITKLKNSYKIWSLIIHDFNVYMFSFVIFYYTITRHFIEYEEELAKLDTVQVIIDPST